MCYHLRMVPIRLAFACLVALLLAACPKSYKRPYSEPGVDAVLASLAARRDAVRSYKATDTTMDYWVGKDRFRGTVLVMGELGAKVRMNALRPDDAVAADLACDGADFVFVDHLKNCVLTGPCNEASIAQLLRVPLAPDDFLYLALGTTPVIPDAQGTIRWDSKRGREVLELTGAGGLQQTIIVDGRDGKQTWDLLRSEVRGADGKVLWTVDHTGYRDLATADGATVRVPGKSNIKTPADKSDLLVEWGKEREVNLDIEDDAFLLDPPAVAMCGASQ